MGFWGFGQCSRIPGALSRPTERPSCCSSARVRSRSGKRVGPRRPAAIISPAQPEALQRALRSSNSATKKTVAALTSNLARLRWFSSPRTDHRPSARCTGSSGGASATAKRRSQYFFRGAKLATRLCNGGRGRPGSDQGRPGSHGGSSGSKSPPRCCTSLARFHMTSETRTHTGEPVSSVMPTRPDAAPDMATMRVFW